MSETFLREKFHKIFGIVPFCGIFISKFLCGERVLGERDGGNLYNSCSFETLYFDHMVKDFHA